MIFLLEELRRPILVVIVLGGWKAQGFGYPLDTTVVITRLCSCHCVSDFAQALSNVKAGLFVDANLIRPFSISEIRAL